MRRLYPGILVAVLAVPLAAQNPPAGPPGPGGGGRPFAPPPDHWMTIDSLVTAVGLTASQRTAIAQPYAALNAVMKQAADRRAAVRRQMQGQGPMAPADMTPEQRARLDSLRVEFEGMQEEADQWYQMIRGALTPEQQGRFDALPPPRVAMRMRRGPGQ